MTVQHVDIDGERVPELLFERHYGEIVDFLGRDIPPNLFQLSWLANHGVRPLANPDLYAFRGIRGPGAELQAVSLVITDRLTLVDAREPEVAARFGRWCRRRSIGFDHVVSAAESVDPFWEAYRTANGDSESGAPAASLIRPQTMFVLESEDWRDQTNERDRPRRTSVRRATIADLEPLFFASAHMHREETLEDPLERDPDSFREHVRHRVESDRSFVWFGDGDRLKFKADISAQSRFGVQISGVYTAPELRGQGLATRALYDICEQFFEEGTPRIVLYVNRENDAARRVYEKVGFETYTEYRTVFVDASD
jgi:ribosomal protein S18 acetylase RimI-like enzyme